MKRSERESLQKRIVQFFVDIANENKSVFLKIVLNQDLLKVYELF
jgi:hypothetical protein